MALAALITSIFSALASMVTVFYTVYLWRRSNRPLVTARVTTHHSGNVNIFLNILVENMGTQPALNVKLQAKRKDVEAAMRKPDGPELLKKAPERVFFSDVVIPMLANGRSMTNSFGALGESGIWQAGSQIPIKLIYEAMDGRRFRERGILLLHSDEGFAQTSWSTG
ncbi:hypothetical protein [Dyella sp.]|uniref:hypothetical protein n=1 Tax=Dyella sp. TaxID=1869338 RepID=UPI003F7D9418